MYCKLIGMAYFTEIRTKLGWRDPSSGHLLAVNNTLTDYAQLIHSILLVWQHYWWGGGGGGGYTALKLRNLGLYSRFCSINYSSILQTLMRNFTILSIKLSQIGQVIKNKRSRDNNRMGIMRSM